MTKEERLTRLGLPEKSEKVIFAVTPEEKYEIQGAARAQRQTVTDYLIGLHRQSVKRLKPEAKREVKRLASFARDGMPIDDIGGVCGTCGKTMSGRQGVRRAIVGGVRSTDLCNLCLQKGNAGVTPVRVRPRKPKRREARHEG